MDYKNTLNLPKTDFPMKANLAQKEPETLKAWDAIDIYNNLRKASSSNQLFILHDGPPYANGRIHLGHTVNKVIKDMIVKSRQLMGMDAPYIPGWDCHGLPIEHNVEKDLGSKKASMDKLEIRERCRQYASKFVSIQRDEFKRLGVLGDWENPYLTMSYDYEAAICKAFCDIFLNGHVIKSKKPVHWCPTCVTALAEAEVEYADHTSASVTVKFKAGEALQGFLHQTLGIEIPAFVLIWTTTPWTLPANLAVALNPAFDYIVIEKDGEAWLMAEGRLMANLAMLGLELKDVKVIGRVAPSKIEKMTLHHPFIERQSLIVLADYVTLEAGTGCVHTAPGHGADDYLTGRRYGLETYAPVDDRGRFVEGLNQAVSGLSGLKIFDANPVIIEMLKERGALVHEEKLRHSYPHCWRCKKPVIFRATSQWFISMEKEGLRKKALDAIEKVEWIPEWGKDRIQGMVKDRPDWCISRQRAWGVPITVFTCNNCETPLMTREIADRLIAMFEKEGADAWFKKDIAELLPDKSKCTNCGSESFKKETDILDVWFDSGVSHEAVLMKRARHQRPADMYLEGSDQHRGWFQSSLLTSVATTGSAPYKAVLTHGFVVDGQGKKMSKSVGNVISPADVIKEFGADVLRLWVTSEDYRDDIKISKEILQRLTEAYRKIRNTVRYLLSNLHDFDPSKPASFVSVEELEDLDKWALWKLNELKNKVKDAYLDYKFHVIFHRTHEFCTVDMSALYLDIVKDRLYCEATDSKKRRSCQTVLWKIAHDLLIMLSPVLSFTAEEAWRYLPKSSSMASESIFFAQYPEAEQLFPDGFDMNVWLNKWETIWKIRAEITKALELARKDKHIGLALDAKVLLFVPDEQAELKSLTRQYLDMLRDLAIVSQLEMIGNAEPQDKALLSWQAEAVEGVKVFVCKAKGAKCARCWQWSEQIGSEQGWQDVCPRCAASLHEMKVVPETV